MGSPLQSFVVRPGSPSATQGGHRLPLGPRDYRRHHLHPRAAGLEESTTWLLGCGIRGGLRLTPGCGIRGRFGIRGGIQNGDLCPEPVHARARHGHTLQEGALHSLRVRTHTPCRDSEHGRPEAADHLAGVFPVRHVLETSAGGAPPALRRDPGGHIPRVHPSF